jgi:hypothetical protein
MPLKTCERPSTTPRTRPLSVGATSAEALAVAALTVSVAATMVRAVAKLRTR